jgi:S1-C subfamily serine protease
VLPSSPAEKAGIRKSDVILALGDQPISGPSELSRRIAAMPPGTRVRLTLVRERKSTTLSVELGRLPERGQ